jgi:flagellar M-ring protein FliF
MLDAMLGPSMSIVRVQAELNMDTEETDQEKVEPLQDQAGKAVVREHTSEETYDATASPRGGGAAGVASSLASGAAAAGSEQSGNYVSKEQTREYEFSRTKTVRKRLPGQITRLSVAAVIDESLPAQAAMRVQDVLSAAAGIARDRGDTVVVERMKLQAAETAQENAKEMETAQKTESRQAIVSLLIKQGLPATLALVLVAVAIRALLEFRRSASEESGSSEPIPGDGSPLSLPDGLPAPPSLEQLAAQQAKAEEERLLRELQRVARERPDVLARELRAWMAGDEVL